MMRQVFLTFLLVLAGSFNAAAAPDFPALSGRIVDQANVIDAASEAELVDLSEAHEAETTNQVVVATVNSLEDSSIEYYANTLLRHWQLGQKNQNNGVLLLVAPNERKVRIEVGYGLEGTLTDALAKFIIEESILPQFRAGDMSAGIVRGMNDIVNVLSGDAEVYEKRRELEDDYGDVIGKTFFFIWALLFFGIPAISFMTRMFGKRQKNGSYKWGPFTVRKKKKRRGGSSGGGWSSSSSSGGFSGGGGSSGGGGASGSW